MKKMMFITGTRADYGKLKSIIRAVEVSEEYEAFVYVTGMHLLPEYGNTYLQIENDGHSNIYIEKELKLTDKMDINIGNTILLMSEYVAKINPDVMVVHGDRIDALAGAVVGILNNILVAHIEGGEITGTVDDSLRHAITKLSHLHFTANEETKLRLLQLGEKDNSIQIIGSPDIDIMLSDELPDYEHVKNQYNIEFDHYGIFMYHPVTTEVECLKDHIEECILGIQSTDLNFIVVYPNNDLGSQIIVNELEKLVSEERFLLIKSFPFEDFLVLLKNSDFIIGNSSAGIREACIYGIPCINIGTRQANRYNPKIMKNIISIPENHKLIQDALSNYKKYKYISYYFGDGHSAELFMEAFTKRNFWEKDIQKTFIDSKATQRGIHHFINEICY